MARTQVKGRAPRRDYRCATCGETLRSWAAAERHRDATGHGRYELIEPEEAR